MSTQTIIEHSWQFDPAAWLEEEIQYWTDAYEADGLIFGFDHADWPVNVKWTVSSDPLSEIKLPHYSDYESPAPDVYIGLFPTTESWQVPAYIKFGGSNDCPLPDVQAGLIRYWSERYGVEVVAMYNREIQFYVASPPSNREDALLLAKEQRIYCGGSVWADSLDLESLAYFSMYEKTWYFWWD